MKIVYKVNKVNKIKKKSDNKSRLKISVLNNIFFWSGQWNNHFKDRTHTFFVDLNKSNYELNLNSPIQWIRSIFRSK